MIGLLVVLFVGLLVGSLRAEPARRGTRPASPATPSSPTCSRWSRRPLRRSCSSSVSYYLLTNVPHTLRDVLPGALAATLVLDVDLSGAARCTSISSRDSPGLQAFGGPVILLVWLYLMANVIVLGAELNWWFARRRARLVEGLPGLA